MKKNIFIAALAALSSVGAMAQDTIRTAEVIQRVDTVNVHYYNKYHSRFVDNWTFEIMGSGRVLFSEEDGQMAFGKRIAPSVQIGIIKEMTPDVSMRGVISGGALKGWNSGKTGLYKWVSFWEEKDPVREYLEGKGQDCSKGYEQNIRYFTLGVDVMLNLSNAFTANKKLNRPLTPYFFAGIEYFQMLKHEGCFPSYKVGGHAGFKCDLKLTDRVALTGELGASLHSATMENEIGKGHRFDAYAGASLGLKVRLGKQDYRLDKVLPTGEYVRLSNVTTGIREEYTEVTKTAIIGNLFAPSVVFDDNAESYSEELQMVNMFRISEYMKDNPKLKVSVIGNTHSVSQDLAERRSNIVRQVLINRYGIDASRLIATTLDVNREYNVKGNDQSVNFGMAQ